MKIDVEERLRGMAVERELVRAMTPTEHATLPEAADTIAALRRENEELREAWEELGRMLWEGALDGFDVQDMLERRGLIVPGEPTEAFLDEWGPETTMYVFRWSDRVLATPEPDDG